MLSDTVRITISRQSSNDIFKAVCGEKVCQRHFRKFKCGLKVRSSTLVRDIVSVNCIPGLGA